MNHEPENTILDKILELQETIFTAFIPLEAQSHFRTSRKEAMLGIKALLDHTFQRIDEPNSEERHLEKHSSHIISITENL